MWRLGPPFATLVREPLFSRSGTMGGRTGSRLAPASPFQGAASAAAFFGGIGFGRAFLGIGSGRVAAS
jgi:hypothetical protein